MKDLSNYEKRWEEYFEFLSDFSQIDALQNQGHSHHCACRQVWGDGECECDLYEKGYNPYAWMAVLKNFKIPPLTEREKIEIEKCRLAERESKLTNFMIGGKP